MIFNSNKDELLESIRDKISEIDAQCGIISHQILLYSDERVNELTLQAEEHERQVMELQGEKNRKLGVLAKLKKDLKYLKGEEAEIEDQCKAKKEEWQHLEERKAFLEEKHKQEAPHLQDFLIEKAKSKDNSAKVRYAKDKLSKLNHQLKKQWDEIQYQYRLNSLVRQKLAQFAKETHLSNDCKNNQSSNDCHGSKGTAISSIDTSEQPPSVLAFKQARNTQLSDYTESIITSFRD